MKPIVGVAEVLAAHMGVDFRCADARVPQQFLDHPKVRPVLQQMRGKAVTKHVRGYRTFDPAAVDPSLDPQPEGDGGKGSPAAGQEDGRRGSGGDEPGSGLTQVPLQHLSILSFSFAERSSFRRPFPPFRQPGLSARATLSH